MHREDVSDVVIEDKERRAGEAAQQGARGAWGGRIVR
jgi:hypothetical protein